MEMNHLDKEWLKIVKEVKKSDITQEEFKAFIESKKKGERKEPLKGR